METTHELMLISCVSRRPSQCYQMLVPDPGDVALVAAVFAVVVAAGDVVAAVVVAGATAVAADEISPAVVVAALVGTGAEVV